MSTQVSLVFFLLVCANLGTELRGEAIDNERYRKEIDAFPSGLTTYDDNHNLVECTKEHGAPSDFKGETTFKIYTKKNPWYGQQLKINDTSSLTESNFDATKPTYFITHGWKNSGNSPSCTLIRDAYLEKVDVNVIVVDWSSYSMELSYVDATSRVKEIGKTVRKMIKWMYSNGLKNDEVALIGHSTGAHIMGIAGYKLKSKVKHIVGLDPALQMFMFAHHSQILSKEDAQHVQIIHTNGGGLGTACPHGHADFFPNGGSIQEGCCGFNDSEVTTWQKLLQVINRCSACSHGRSFEFFAESIAKDFVATRCRSYLDFQDHNCGAKPHTAVMGGLNLAEVKPGTYYLRTGSKKPFSKVRANSVNNYPALIPILTNALCNILQPQQSIIS